MKKFVKLLILLNLILCCNYSLASQANQNMDKSFNTYIQQAKSLESTGKIQEANIYYLKAQKIFPNRFEALFGLAKTYGWLNNDKQAFDYYEKLIKLAPKNVALLETYAQFLKDHKYSIKALEIYSKLIDITHNQKYNLDIAEIYIAQGNTDPAIELYKNILEENPDNIAVIKTLAQLYFSQGKYAEAVPYFQSYLSKEPDNSLMLDYGKSLFYSGNKAAAAPVLENYLETNPSNPDALKTLGDVYLSLNDFKKASEVFTKIVALDPADNASKLKLAQSYIVIKDYPNAKKILEELYTVMPDNPVILKGLGDISFYNSDFKSALNYYLTLYTIQQNDELFYRITQCYQYNKNFDKAEEFYKLLLASPEYKNRALLGLADIDLSKKNNKQARDLYNRVLIEDPRNINAMFGLAQVDMALDNYHKAITLLKRLPPGDEINYQLALSYKNIDRPDLALKLLKNNSLAQAKTLEDSIRNNKLISFEPIYAFDRMAGDPNHSLNANSFGGQLTANVKPNIQINGTVLANLYYAGDHAANATSVTYTIGSKGKPFDKLGYDGYIGIDQIADRGAALIGKILLNMDPNDILTLNLGFDRERVMQSMLSYSGLIPTASTSPFANTLVGEDINNKLLTNLSIKLPHNYYLYSGYNFGVVTGHQIPANPYDEVASGIGKTWLSKPDKTLVNLVQTGYGFYYSHYSTNRYGFGGASLDSSPIGSDGISQYPSPGNPGIGGYFSPDYIVSNTLLLKLGGDISALRLKYMLNPYIGIQSIKETGSDILWGGAIGVGLNEDGKLGLRVTYQVNNYAYIVQQNLLAKLIFRI